MLVRSGAVPIFVHLLDSSDEDIRFYSAAALSNIAVNGKCLVMDVAAYHSECGVDN